MDNDSPWLYVAMIVIAFISWILSRIQEFTNARKEAKMRKKHPEQYRQAQQRETPDEDTWLPDEDAFSPPTRDPSAARPDLADTFRDLIEALGGQPETASPHRQPPPSPRSSPPPIRRPRQSAVTKIPTDGPATARPTVAPPTKPFAAAKPRDNDLSRARRLLNSPSGIRQAMILKEILGDPKGMW